MAWFKFSLAVLFTSFIAHNLPHWMLPRLPLYLDGKADEKFSKVQEVFRRNFEDGSERDGAAFAVYHKGKLVVDLWGGYADTVAYREWKPDTYTNAFSSTKAVGALCVAHLVDQGHLKYTDLMTKYWPEFSRHDKGNITVHMVMHHQAGLAMIDTPIRYADARDWEKMSQLFVHQRPLWPAGTKIGYHAVTWGWLLDQIIRRADPKHRGVGQFFHEEIAKPNDIDFYIGLPLELEHRVARMTASSPFEWAVYCLVHEPHLIKRLVQYLYLTMFSGSHDGSIFDGVINNPEWLKVAGNQIPYNNPDVHRLEIASANGVGTAKGMAKLFSLLIEGKLLSKEMMENIKKPVEHEDEELVIGMKLDIAYGFMLHEMEPGHWVVGHLGYGGQVVRFDMKNHLAYAYLNNGLKPGLKAPLTYQALHEALYDSL